jgi:hypothetical protein
MVVFTATATTATIADTDSVVYLFMLKYSFLFLTMFYQQNSPKTSRESSRQNIFKH